MELESTAVCIALNLSEDFLIFLTTLLNSVWKLKNKFPRVTIFGELMDTRQELSQ